MLSNTASITRSASATAASSPAVLSRAIAAAASAALMRPLLTEPLIVVPIRFSAASTAGAAGSISTIAHGRVVTRG